MDFESHHNNYYKKRRDAHGTAPEGAGWKSKEAQEIRFKQLLKIIGSGSGFSVNDIGCGFGHLLDYMQGMGFSNFVYRGYDLLKEMIDQAREKYSQKNEVKFCCIDHISEIDSADYCLASGIFSLKGDISEGKWLAYILETIEEMDRKSSLGFGFNMLTKYSDPEYMEKELYYADPCFMFDFCKRNFSRNVALLHDYQEYDFTILVRK